MKFEMKKKHWIVLSVMLIASAAFRLIPNHPANFAPMAGMALLGAAYIKRSWLAWILPVAIFWISDLVLNNTLYAAYYDGFVFASNAFLFSAGAMLLMVILGRVLLKQIKIQNLVLASISASLIFFLVSNFGAWLDVFMPYPKTLVGLLEAYVAGLPFLKGTMIGDLVFTGVLFGAWQLIFRTKTVSQVATERI